MNTTTPHTLSETTLTLIATNELVKVQFTSGNRFRCHFAPGEIQDLAVMPENFVTYDAAKQEPIFEVDAQGAGWCYAWIPPGGKHTSLMVVSLVQGL